MAIDARTLCLAALSFGDCTGYEIRRFYEDGPYSCFYRVGFGSIYPALTQSLADGLVTVRTDVQAGRPGRKVYSLTPAGWAWFRQALQGTPAVDRFRSDMLFILSFGHLLEPENRRQRLDDYVAEQQGLLDGILADEGAGAATTPGHAFIRAMGKAIYQTVIRTVAENRHLLEGGAENRPAPDGV